MKILIDNGLGRDTTGKRSPDGRLLAWSYTREIARRVVAELQAQHYYASLLIPEEEDIPLDERCRRVNRVCGTCISIYREFSSPAICRSRSIRQTCVRLWSL